MPSVVANSEISGQKTMEKTRPKSKTIKSARSDYNHQFLVPIKKTSLLNRNTNNNNNGENMVDKIYSFFNNSAYNVTSSNSRSRSTNLPSLPTSELIRDRLKLSVGGQRFEISKYLVERFPDTLLGNKELRDKYYSPDEEIYHFDRHPVAFLDILYFYQSEGKHLEKSETVR